jgi:FtsP/CotA-like multicopper oxidase with cupredoxin domain
MGRFGNVLLIGGEPDCSLTVKTGEVVRLWLTNTANTRVFNMALPGARMKLVGGDSGQVEYQEFVSEVILAPSERAVVDVLVDRPGQLELQHRTPGRTYRLAAITVTGDQAAPSLAEEFEVLRTAPELVAEREFFDTWLEAPPDKTPALVAEMDDIAARGQGPVIYSCPMHPEVTSAEPGRCPQCGMKLLVTALAGQSAGREPAAAAPAGGTGDDHGAEHGHHGEGHGYGDGGGIEWEDDMVAVNRLTTPANMRWMLVDRDSGAVNAAIDWRFTVGDRVKIRLVNEMDSDHPMHHPFHLLGAGRFLVLARDGAAEPNLVWKDTVLVRTGQTTDILFDVTEPGLWMAHCHIAEHMQSGMMFSFTVARTEAAR